MPRKPKQPPIACEFFVWHLRVRGGVFYADSRGGKFNLGKHSLGTKDREEAIDRLRQIDRAKAVELGLVEAGQPSKQTRIGISDGWRQYLEYSGRSQVLGGVAPKSLRRYELVRDRHVPYCERHGIETWNEFDRKAFERYGNWMFKAYAYRTCYVELTQVKAACNWLIQEGLLPAECKLVYALRKPQGSDTYCYGRDEVALMVDHCRSNAGLEWLANVILGLAHTGMRIGELTGLRWSDVDLKANVIRIADERSSRRKVQAGTARTTKGRRSRSIPIHPELRKLLVKLDRRAGGHVFRAARGGILRENNALRILKEQVIQPLAKKFPTVDGEIGFEHGTFHSLRHFFCSQCFLGGASEGEIREWLGHRDSKVVELYRHLRDEDAQRKMEQMDFLGRDAQDDDARPADVA
jgi:integrase